MEDAAVVVAALGERVDVVASNGGVLPIKLQHDVASRSRQQDVGL
jgi:hypothetical protein